MNQGRLLYRQSMDGYWVPIINNTPLYSLISVSSDLEKFATTNTNTISPNDRILFLGLGLNYHIEAALENAQSSVFKHAVIEPNKKLCNDLNKLRKDSIPPHIFTIEMANEIIESEEIINFLLLNPVIIGHKPSIIANKRFFAEIYHLTLSPTLLKIFGPLQNYIAEQLNLPPKTTVLHKLNIAG